MENWLIRTELLLGKEKMRKIKDTRVAILGLGGVGGAAAQGICRFGVENILLVDRDSFSITNINRQLAATTKTIGIPKTTAVAQQLRDINPAVQLTLWDAFVLPDNCQLLWDFQPDFIIDAIDTVTTKLFLAKEAKTRGIRLVSSMGTGGRMDPTQLRLGDISSTVGTSCALSRVLRKELKKRDIHTLDVVYSLETPSKVIVGEENGRHPPASSAVVPPAAGFALASFVIRNL